MAREECPHGELVARGDPLNQPFVRSFGGRLPTQYGGRLGDNGNHVSPLVYSRPACQRAMTIMVPLKFPLPNGFANTVSAQIGVPPPREVGKEKRHYALGLGNRCSIAFAIALPMRLRIAGLLNSGSSSF